MRRFDIAFAATSAMIAAALAFCVWGAVIVIRGESCTVDCHPDGAHVRPSGECWCLPEGEAPYRPGGAQ